MLLGPDGKPIKLRPEDLRSKEERQFILKETGVPVSPWRRYVRVSAFGAAFAALMAADNFWTHGGTVVWQPDYDGNVKRVIWASNEADHPVPDWVALLPFFTLTTTFLTPSDTSPWTVPGGVSTITLAEVVGAGAGTTGNGSNLQAASGGGAYANKANVPVSGTAAFSVAGNAWFKTVGTVSADPGSAGSFGTPGSGGTFVAGDAGNPGGAGGGNGASSAGGGGGAGGPHGAGVTGSDGSGLTGGDGGAGDAGSGGAGGAGGAGGGDATPGSDGSNFGGGKGCGGGGGGDGAIISTLNAGYGGQYGGGSGGLNGSENSQSASGSCLIVLTYTIVVLVTGWGQEGQIDPAKRRALAIGY